jgi:hypothetical protein
VSVSGMFGITIPKLSFGVWVCPPPCVQDGKTMLIKKMYDKFFKVVVSFVQFNQRVSYF